MPAATEEKKTPRNKDENGKRMDAFKEILAIMDVEHLIRFRHRLGKVGRKRMVEILTEEIDVREKAGQI